MDAFKDCEIFRAVHSGLGNVPEIPHGVRAVDLRRNKISILNFDTCDQSVKSSVIYFDVSDNNIVDILPIQSFPNIRVLDASYNNILKIPCLRLESLEELYLISNDIKSMKNICFRNLKKLDLANNEIVEIGHIEAPHLEELYLSSNHLSAVKDLRYLEHLRVLDLQYNYHLNKIDCSLLPPNLRILLLQGNKFLTSVENIDCLPNLEIISLKETKVTNVEGRNKLEVW